MKYVAHTDMTSFYGTRSEIYDHLKKDQERDSRYQQFSQAGLIGLTLLASFGWSSSWTAAPWLTAGAVMALERCIWWGREMSTRNQLMHTLTLERRRLGDDLTKNPA